MRKIYGLVLVLILLVFFTACSNDALVQIMETATTEEEQRQSVTESSHWEEENEMLLIETGKESFCFYQDEETLLYGIYDNLKNEIVLNAVYEEIGTFGDSVVAPVKKDGYWGYINCLGEVVIDFYYDKADCFKKCSDGSSAPVYCDGSGWGAIGEDGTYIVEPQYDNITIYEDCYIVGGFNSGFCEVYNCDGKKIADKSVEGYPFEKVHFYRGKIYAGIRRGDLYEVYDLDGNRLTGEGSLSDVLYVSLPVNGVHVLYCAEKESYLNYYRDTGMRLADELFNLLNNKLYTDVSDFNALGLAVAEENYSAWFVLKKDGSVFKELPTHEIYDLAVNYTYANDYLACCQVSVGMTGGTHYGVVDLGTDKLTRWGEVTPVDGTNCIIVTDAETKLKGLYDENKLVLECLYQDIEYENGLFRYTRGAVNDLYTPVEQEKTVQIIREAQSYADEGSYISAIKHLNGVRVANDEVIAKRAEYKESHNKQILVKAEKYWNEEKYVEAITALRNEVFTDNDTYACLTEYLEKHYTILLEEARELAQNGDYEQAISCLQEGRSYVLYEDVAEIEKKIDEYKRKQAG